MFEITYNDKIYPKKSKKWDDIEQVALQILDKKYGVLKVKGPGY